jgi:hypothetical protein
MSKKEVKKHWENDHRYRRGRGDWPRVAFSSKEIVEVAILSLSFISQEDENSFFFCGCGSAGVSGWEG